MSFSITCRRFVASSWFTAVICLIGLGSAGSFAQSPPGSTARLENLDNKSIVAYVNGEPISRRELADELLVRRGKEQLELLINRRIIEHACKEAGLEITDAEVEEELKDTLRSLGIVDQVQFEERFLKERNSSLYEYKNDVLKPTIAMRKLAGNRTQVTKDDIHKAYEAAYGEKVRCRVIVVHDMKSAYKLHAEVRNDPEAFLHAARNQKESGLAAVAGLMRINRHSELEQVEKEAFRLKDGEVSQILEVTPERFVIMRREMLEPADPSKKIQDVWDVLAKEVQGQKIREELPKVFKEIRKEATVRNFLDNRFDLEKPRSDSSKPNGRPTTTSPE